MSPRYTTRPTELDELLTVLSNQYRRAVLSYFRETAEDVTSVGSLASEIRRREPDDTDRIVVHLHHSALPQLDDVNALTYDERDGMVRYHGHPELEALHARIVDR